MVFEILKYIIFKHLCNNGSVDQLVERLTGVLKVPGTNPSKGEYFSLKLSFKEEMRQKEKRNNSSNSLVFGRWPHTINE